MPQGSIITVQIRIKRASCRNDFKPLRLTMFQGIGLPHMGLSFVLFLGRWMGDRQ